MFELTMLFAGASNFIALVVFSALARRRVAPAVRDLVSAERMVVVVPLSGMDSKLRDAVRGVLGGAVTKVPS